MNPLQSPLPPPRCGTCRCGEIRMEVTAAPRATFACHCRGCQRMTSSAFSLSAMVPAEGFEVVAGEPVRGGAHSEGIAHFHCPQCMSWVFTRMTALPQFVNIRPILFDEADWCRPFAQTMTCEKLDWVSTPAAHSFEGFPSTEEFMALLEDFSATA